MLPRFCFFFFSSRRRHTRLQGDWSSDVCSSDLTVWFLRAGAVAGVAAVVALECGWIVTEVGRQPWTVYKLLRTEDAVTGATGIWLTLAVALVLYTALGVATVIALRVMARRWRAGE